MTDTKKYLVLISAGWPTDYGPKVGWDELHATRAEAEAMAERADRHDGWAAKVVAVED
jgi:hypothetical protein